MERKFSVDGRIFEKFPELCVGVVVCRNIENKGIAKEVMDLLREREGEIREKMDVKTLSENPKIKAWRDAYRSFGGKPKKYKNSAENLLRRVLKGEETRHISKIVDIYNFLSLKYMVPAGGEDLDKTKGNIELTIAGENEEPVLLLGEREPRPPHPGEVIYKDGISAICRRFNWKEAERSKISEESRKAVLVVEGLPPTTREVIELFLNELRSLVEKNCGGTIKTAILDMEDKATRL